MLAPTPDQTLLSKADALHAGSLFYFTGRPNRCAFFADCGHTFEKRKFHIDHIIALAAGGSNWPNNIQLLCASCNLRKAKTDPLEYARRQGRIV